MPVTTLSYCLLPKNAESHQALATLTYLECIKGVSEKASTLVAPSAYTLTYTTSVEVCALSLQGKT